VSRASPATSLGQAAEATVVALAMSGDVAAFTELVHRRQSWLRNLLRRLARDPALADDLAQQVLLQAWRALPRLRSVAAFGGWLRRLAVNAWLAQLRAAPPPTVCMDAGEDSRELASAGTAREGGAAEALDLDRALERLTPDERLCVVLAYSEGMSHSEISAATQLPLGTVKSHVRRGAERLRALLHAYQPTGDRAHAAG
jgi:RNA polymerase sigma-70 factor (ECF subfamily)